MENGKQVLKPIKEDENIFMDLTKIDRGKHKELVKNVCPNSKFVAKKKLVANEKHVTKFVHKEVNKIS